VKQPFFGDGIHPVRGQLQHPKTRAAPEQNAKRAVYPKALMKIIMTRFIVITMITTMGHRPVGMGGGVMIIMVVLLIVLMMVMMMMMMMNDRGDNAE
jgi:hypothetical protein